MDLAKLYEIPNIILTTAGKLLDLELRGQPAGEMQAGGRGLVETVEAAPGGQGDAPTNNVHNQQLYTIT